MSSASQRTFDKVATLYRTGQDNYDRTLSWVFIGRSCVNVGEAPLKLAADGPGHQCSRQRPPMLAGHGRAKYHHSLTMIIIITYPNNFLSIVR
jgi:hypothetical protein